VNPPSDPASARPLDPEASRPMEHRDEVGTDEELPLPVGTLFLMMLYVMVMAGMWFGMYFEFLGR
jgi:hypothetical protein